MFFNNNKVSGHDYNLSLIEKALKGRNKSENAAEESPDPDELLANKYAKTITVGDDTAYKPYFYVRNGLLHVKYVCDRCIELNPREEKEVKKSIAQQPSFRQQILGEKWDFLLRFANKSILDGRAASQRVMRGLTEMYTRNAEPKKKVVVVKVKNGSKN